MKFLHWKWTVRGTHNYYTPNPEQLKETAKALMLNCPKGCSQGTGGFWVSRNVGGARDGELAMMFVVEETRTYYMAGMAKDQVAMTIEPFDFEKVKNVGNLYMDEWKNAPVEEFETYARRLLEDVVSRIGGWEEVWGKNFVAYRSDSGNLALSFCADYVDSVW